MIKQTLKDNLNPISIDKVDFSYRIPVKKIGNTIDWKIGEKGTEGLVFKSVSTWTLQLFTKNTGVDKFIQEFISIIKEHSPKNTINWEDTLLAVNIQNEYNSRIALNNKADKKTEENEIISILKKKYKVD